MTDGCNAVWRNQSTVYEMKKHKRPAILGMFFENYRSSENCLNYCFNYSLSSSACMLTFHHGNNITNIPFGDGHVESLSPNRFKNEVGSAGFYVFTNTKVSTRL